MVRDREDADLLANYGVDDAEREASCDKTTFAATPHRAETWILHEKADGVLELREERLR